MARAALVKDGTVVEVVEVGWNWTPPEGYLVVESDEAAVGQTYDGSTFAYPPISAEELIYHASMRYTEQPLYLVSVAGAGDLSLWPAEINLVSRLAERARKNANFSYNWGMHDGTGKTVHLHAPQLIEFDDKVTELLAQNHSTFTALLDGVHAGAVTTHAQIDGAPWGRRLKRGIER
jgi:hypothetical protein